MQAFVDRALDAKSAMDYHFWALKCAEVLDQLPQARRLEVYRAAARRIGVTFKAERQRKQALLARLAKAATED